MTFIQVPCSTCNGGGILGVITREMATDAEAPDLEGQVIECHVCGGRGWLPKEVDAEEPAP